MKKYISKRCRGGDITNWLKGCEICNAGLIAEVDRQCKGGIPVLTACNLLVKEIERKFKVSPYTADALRNRYRYYKGLKDIGQNGQPHQKKTKRNNGVTPTPKPENKKT